jgi:hypothetical protein
MRADLNEMDEIEIENPWDEIAEYLQLANDTRRTRRLHMTDVVDAIAKCENNDINSVNAGIVANGYCQYYMPYTTLITCGRIDDLLAVSVLPVNARTKATHNMHRELRNWERVIDDDLRQEKLKKFFNSKRVVIVDRNEIPSLLPELPKLKKSNLRSK